MKKKRIIIPLIFILAVLAFFLIFTLIKSQITGQIIKEKYSYTKAICDENNFCEDYTIVCEGDEVASMTPTGAFIKHDENWKDPRGKDNNNLCQ